MEETEDGMTMLMKAVRSGNKGRVLWLVRSGGVSIDVRDELGTTGLMWASLFGDAVMATSLIAYGVDVHALDNIGKMALMYASEYDRVLVIRLLVIVGGAVVDAADKNGETALMYASKWGRASAVQFLLNHNANVNMADHAGRIAVSFATDRHHPEVQRLLMPHLEWANGATISCQRETMAQSTKSWFISPFDIELQGLMNREDAGVQFRAKWLDAEVVVKLFVRDAAKASFAEEVTVWRQLCHPNVLKLYGACNAGHYFFVSEYTNNGSLVEYLAARRSASEKCTPWKFLLEAALGLAYLHERNMIHDNIRGSSIWIGSDCSAKLGDLGSVISSHHTKNPVYGSTRWQSPERVRGEAASFASDIYSLGLTVIEALSGRVPWWYERYDLFTTKNKGRWNPATNARDGKNPGTSQTNSSNWWLACARTTLGDALLLLWLLSLSSLLQRRNSKPTKCLPSVS